MRHVRSIYCSSWHVEILSIEEVAIAEAASTTKWLVRGPDNSIVEQYLRKK